MSKLEQTQRHGVLTCGSLSRHHRLNSHSALSAFALLFAGVLFHGSAQGQTVRVVAQPVRITVPINTSISNGVTFSANLSSTNITTLVHLSVSGLPVGATSSISTNDFTNNVTGVLTINTVNVPEGLSTYSVDGSGGATGNLLLTIQSAHVWTGAAFTNGGSADFSNTGNWVGGLAAGSTSDVVLNDSSAVGSGVLTTNVLISTETEIASLRQAITSGGTRRHNIQIEAGRTLKITGTNGMNMGLRDRSDTAQAWELAFTGADGTLIVSNQDAVISTFTGANQAPRWLMSNLGNFVADVYRIGISDYRAYPNYSSLIANQYGSTAYPRAMQPGQNFLARTNVIKCSFPGDANNWNDPAIRDYSFIVGRNEAVGSTGRQPFYFGISNVFFMNSICFAGAGISMDAAGNAVFNPAFASSNSIAIFRGTNGMNDRMAMFCLADDAGVGSSTSHSKALVDFSAGIVDVLVDRLYLGRDRTNGTGSTGQGVLTMKSGVIDCNVAILGFQGQVTNYGTDISYAQGTVNVNSNGIFRVNDTLELGYTTGAAGSPAAYQTGNGKLTVGSGGTVMANTIKVGGVSKVSIDNTITINGGTLIVSNSIADADKYLSTLTLSSGATLLLNVDTTNTAPQVYATNIITIGNNTLQIANIGHLAATAVPLIAYNPGSTPGTISSLVLPVGVNGVLLDDGAGTIYLSIITNAPKNLLWQGYVNGNWDKSSQNWLDLDTTLHTTFSDGDSVSFDDSALIKTVNISETSVVASSMVVSNTASVYNFSGGRILGSSALVKLGTNVLQIDDDCGLVVQINEGVFAGSGVVASASIAAGATIAFDGTISAGLTCGGAGQITGNSGNGSSTLTVASSGVLTNVGSYSGSFTVATNGYLYNSGTLKNIGSSTVSSNSTLINEGNIGVVLVPGSMVVNGTFKDTGVGTITLDTVTIGAGATFIPGGDGIGTTTIKSTGLGSFPGRLLLGVGSKTLIKVDLSQPQPNTLIKSAILSLGPNQANIDQNGGTLAITNLSLTPLAAGNSFQLFQNSFNSGNPLNAGLNTTNSLPVIDPAAPGFGLLWNVRNMPLTGVIEVYSVQTAPFSLTSSTSFTVVTNATSTNDAIVFQFSWPESYTGWTLERQATTLTNGLRPGETNWTRLVTTAWTNTITITNVLKDDPAIFYRMVYP